MRGSIIVMIDEQSFQVGDISCPWPDYEMRLMIPGCDYVIEDEDTQEFIEAITSLEELYGLPSIPFMSVELDGKAREVAVLDQAHIDALKKGLGIAIAERIERVKAELEKPKPDLWNIAYEAYNYSPVYFATSSRDFLDFLNEVSFVDVLDGQRKFYITETYRFHF